MMMCVVLVSEWSSLRGAARRRKGLAFRPGTRANQQSAVMLYVAFALYFALQDFPAAAEGLLVFAEFLADAMRAVKSVTNVLSAVRTFHLEYRFDVAAFDDYNLGLFKRALNLTVRHCPQPAPPLSVLALGELCSYARRLGANGKVFAAFLATLFFSMARASSLLPSGQLKFDGTRLPTFGDLKATKDGFQLFLKWGKTRQAAGDGFWVPLFPCTGSGACPVRALKMLLHEAGSRGPTLPLFSLTTSQGTFGHCSLSLRLAREWLRVCAEAVGRGAEKLTLHSFRRGACTKAFMEGAEVADIKELGGWHSEAVQRYYPALEARKRAARFLTN